MIKSFKVFALISLFCQFGLAMHGGNFVKALISRQGHKVSAAFFSRFHNKIPFTDKNTDGQRDYGSNSSLKIPVIYSATWLSLVGGIFGQSEQKKEPQPLKYCLIDEDGMGADPMLYWIDENGDLRSKFVKEYRAKEIVLEDGTVFFKGSTKADPEFHNYILGIFYGLR